MQVSVINSNCHSSLLPEPVFFAFSETLAKVCCFYPESHANESCAYEGCPETMQPRIPLFFLLHDWILCGLPLYMDPGLKMCESRTTESARETGGRVQIKSMLMEKPQ